MRRLVEHLEVVCGCAVYDRFYPDDNISPSAKRCIRVVVVICQLLLLRPSEMFAGVAGSLFG